MNIRIVTPLIYIYIYIYILSYVQYALSLGVFDFMQHREKRSLADLKQCMLVRKCVRLEPVPMPRHCQVWYRESISRAAGSFSRRSFSRATAGALITTQLFFGICPGHWVYTPTLYEKCHGIFNDHRASGPRFNVSSERRCLLTV